MPGHAVPPRQRRPAPAPVADSPRVGRLVRDVADGGARVVDAFWAEAAAAGTPLIESVPGGDGASGDEVIATFLWRGAGGDRGATALVNKLHDRANPEASRMRRVEGTDVWWLGYRLPSDWRGSYQFMPDVAQDGGAPTVTAAAAVPDPLNPHRLAQPGGAPDKSVAAMPDAPDPGHLETEPGTPAGRVVEHGFTSAALGNRRRVWVHTPHGYDGHGEGDGPYPLLVLLDGAAWFETAPIAPALDRLYAEGALPPAVTVGVDTLGASVRGEELTCHEPFVRFVTDELLPWVERRWAVTGDPARTVIAGQSLGGLAAAFIAGAAPERIGCVLAQSPSLWWGGRERSGNEHGGNAPGAAAQGAGGAARREWLTDWYARRERLPLRLYLEVGCDEWVNLAPARRFRDVLRGKGYPLDYREFSGGHDNACWRVGLAGGLQSIARHW